jgi:type I restriction enzyme M protein
MATQKLPLASFETFLLDACDIIKNTVDVSEYKQYIIPMLFLKRVNDQFAANRDLRKKKIFEGKSMSNAEKVYYELEKPNAPEYDFFVPQCARWEKLDGDPDSNEDDRGEKYPYLKDLKEQVSYYLNRALSGLEDYNSDKLGGVFKNNINFNRIIGKNDRQISDETLRELIRHFGKTSLSDDSLVFPGLTDAVYEFLIKPLSNKAGKKAKKNPAVKEVIKVLTNIFEPTTLKK